MTNLFPTSRTISIAMTGAEYTGIKRGFLEESGGVKSDGMFVCVFCERPGPCSRILPD